MTDLVGLPAGTVAFLFTDLEGSTRLLQAHPAAYREAVARHHDLLRGAVEAHGGAVFETVGDAVYAAFHRPTDAVAAALAGQRALQAESWGATGALRVRMGVHLGEVEAYPIRGAAQGARYFGQPLVHCARLMAAAHGGQVVLSEAAAALVRDALPAGAALRDLGAPQLKDLQRPERVFQLLHPDLPGEFPPLRSLDARPHNLPLQLTSFVGRERELGEVTGLLAAQRLVTLTGPGGTGKTRLALQAAAEVLEEHPDGVWLVELAALADPALVPQAGATAAGVREEPGRPLLATLTDALRPKRVLLVLDNCEHLLEACARLADALLRACPGLRVLATSREALGIAGETAWRVPSLPVPAAGAGTGRDAPGDPAALARYAAVRLFCERAAAVRPGFALTADNGAAVAEVCAWLDGIPLALELAAARVRVLPPRQLRARLDDRFRLLTGGSRTALARHQTLQATVDWSYDLLTVPERALFARLAVFAGGFTLEAAEAVGAAGPDRSDGGGIAPDAVLDRLTRLVDTSLVVAEEQADGTARYRLLETLRQYAAERLDAGGAAEAVAERHAAYYQALAEHEYAIWEDPRGTITDRERDEADELLGRLEQERDNLRAVLGWCARRGRAAQGLRLATALQGLWYARGGLTEGRERLEQFLRLGGADVAPEARARALSLGSSLARHQGDLPAARVLAAQAVPLWRELGDRRSLAVTLQRLAIVAREQGAYTEARRLLEESVALARALSDRGLLATGLDRLATVAVVSGSATAARPLYEESIALAREVGDELHLVWGLQNLAALLLDAGEPAAARALASESAWIRLQRGDRLGMVHTLAVFAGLAAAAGRPEAALRLAGALEANSESVGVRLTPTYRRWLDRWLRAARRELDPVAQNVAWEAGRAMPLEQVVTDALQADPRPSSPSSGPLSGG